MQSQQAYNAIAESRVVVGMRGHFPPDTALTLAAIMIEHDMNVFEFTLNSTEPIAAMQAVKREYGDAVCVGMGTVLTADDAERVLDAGADFVVSPAFQPHIVQMVLDRGVLMAPGVMTPSEAINAWEMGVPLLKIFPIGTLGLDYFKAIIAPLSELKFMCNGGINGENSVDFLKAGAVACGMAGWLTGDGHRPESWLRDRAAQMRMAVRQAAGEGGRIV